ncbi:MAG: hypothetical protein IPM64_07175 [Phycisphaerales bacterium]|nr:hypothetical protein [Phycisphaerales bacterium]
MSPIDQLIFAIWILYALECLAALPRDSFWIWSPGIGGYRALRVQGLPGTPNSGLAPVAPLPFSPGLAVQVWPVSVSPEGISSRRAQHIGCEESVGDAPRFSRWEELPRIESQLSTVFISPGWSVRCVGPHAARTLARRLESLRLAAPAARDGAIRAMLRRGHDASRAKRVLSIGMRRGRYLRMACLALILFFVVIGPALAWRGGLSATWPALLGTLLLLWGYSVIEFNLAHRRLWRRESLERFKRTFVAAATPLAAARGYDNLLRDRLSAFSVLTAGLVTLAGERRAAFARDVLADLRYPCHGSDEEGASHETAVWMREVLRGITERALGQADLGEEELLAPPAPEDAACRSYCPRCRSQFVQPAESCARCPGVRPLAWTERAEAAGVEHA